MVYSWEEGMEWWVLFTRRWVKREEYNKVSDFYCANGNSIVFAKYTEGRQHRGIVKSENAVQLECH